MIVKELKKILENVDDEIEIKISSPCWRNSMDVFQAYLDKKAFKLHIFYIEVKEYGV